MSLEATIDLSVGSAQEFFNTKQNNGSLYQRIVDYIDKDINEKNKITSCKPKKTRGEFPKYIFDGQQFIYNEKSGLSDDENIKELRDSIHNLVIFIPLNDKLVDIQYTDPNCFDQLEKHVNDIAWKFKYSEKDYEKSNDDNGRTVIDLKNTQRKGYPRSFNYRVLFLEKFTRSLIYDNLPFNHPELIEKYHEKEIEESITFEEMLSRVEDKYKYINKENLLIDYPHLNNLTLNRLNLLIRNEAEKENR